MSLCRRVSSRWSPSLNEHSYPPPWRLVTRQSVSFDKKASEKKQTTLEKKTEEKEKKFK
ncbi:Protein CBG25629 [Caenorhabditis briggsae]|uniref:Protein CBG25629 n=1 Tax=Caenorhabditis briggsae TaxID=6238 RepID=B6IFB3_CAEBR|nr:Protein CBG25629 [Caenorhabditis briggsae]CAR98593.1 Protein CBG25629 [Caenorhabditis briggsae]